MRVVAPALCVRTEGRARDGKNCVLLAFVGSEDIKVIKHLVNRGASLDSKVALDKVPDGFGSEGGRRPELR
eukprot:Skav212381  [mRNA]  locus=scaffold45:11123:13032:- [translate_table: standard]